MLLVPLLLSTLVTFAKGSEDGQKLNKGLTEAMSLQEWDTWAFSNLPCFDHSNLRADGVVVFNEKAEDESSSAGYEEAVKEEPEALRGIQFDQFALDLRAMAMSQVRLMQPASRWVDVGREGFNVSAVLEEANFFDLDADASVRDSRKPGKWGGRTPDAHARTGNGGQFPFVGRLLLPEDAILAVFGDLHGSLHSLLRELRGLRARGYLGDDWRVSRAWRGRFFMVFLGDFVDRGSYGVEVLATVARLVRWNVGSVFLSRGNHEDVVLNKFAGTFANELEEKFGKVDGKAAQHLVQRFYDLLPLAFFIGTRPQAASDVETIEDAWAGARVKEPLRGSFVLACHGGLEVGYDPTPLLTSEKGEVEGGKKKAMKGARVLYAPVLSLMRKEWLNVAPQGMRDRVPRDLQKQLFQNYRSDDESSSVPASRTQPWPLPPMGPDPGVGFLWSDFLTEDRETTIVLSRGRGPAHGLDFTRFWLRRAGVAAVLRAHQHNDNPIAGPMLSHLRKEGGAVDNWGQENLVVTFLSATECPGFEFHHDSFGLLHVDGTTPSTWRFQHCSHHVGKQIVQKEHGTWWRDGEKVDVSQLLPGASVAKGVDHICDTSSDFECRDRPFGARSPRVPRMLAAVLGKAARSSSVRTDSPTGTTVSIESIAPLARSTIFANPSTDDIIQLVLRIKPRALPNTTTELPDQLDVCVRLLFLNDSAIEAAFDPLSRESNTAKVFAHAVRAPGLFGDALGETVRQNYNISSLGKAPSSAKDKMVQLWKQQAINRRSLVHYGQVVCGAVLEEDGEEDVRHFTVSTTVLPEGFYTLHAVVRGQKIDAVPVFRVKHVSG